MHSLCLIDLAHTPQKIAIIEYFIDGLAVPDTGREFLAKYKLRSMPHDLVRLRYPFAPYYIVLERVN